MNDYNDGFHFYSSENDGYRGGFGDYTDPIPTTGGPANPFEEPPKKRKKGSKRKKFKYICPFAREKNCYPKKHPLIIALSMK